MTELIPRPPMALVHQPRPVFYRYQESMHAECSVRLDLHEYVILKTTKHGAWIDVWGVKKFVKLDARKRYACPTKEEALASFRARKQRQIKLLRAQLTKAETALNLSEAGQKCYYGWTL